ncbi:MAG: helix-turn-helix domain-containing protein [Leptolyngbyaceae cyanobacterium MO_188.B28]|nr:helix-turn-helix domain-containing protein [Leptolyngbyaceae cyanobacterium MO_188.B28]
MAPSKLSAEDKQDIIELYRQPGQTTSTIAERYGVSGSTISRVLKSTLPDEEYGALIQQKRLTVDKPQPKFSKVQPGVETPRTASSAVSSGTPFQPSDEAVHQAEKAPAEKPVIPPPKIRGLSKRRRPQTAENEPATQLPLLEMTSSPVKADASTLDDSREYSLTSADFGAAAEDETILAEEIDEVDQLVPDDDYEDEDDLEDDDTLEDGDLEDWEEDEEIAPPKLQHKAAIQVIPLTEAHLPNPCYLVVDRLAELITRPLREFGELGQIPETEVQSRTLPVFDNHRVARRFSRRNQRVVKVPDGTVLRKTSAYLQEKGITHLLVDGQIYSLN